MAKEAPGLGWQLPGQATQANLPSCWSRAMPSEPARRLVRVGEPIGQDPGWASWIASWPAGQPG